MSKKEYLPLKQNADLFCKHLKEWILNNYGKEIDKCIIEYDEIQKRLNKQKTIMNTNPTELLKQKIC